MLALIAHDQKKTALVEFVLRHRDVFERSPLVATGSTGRLARGEGGARRSSASLTARMAAT